MTTDAAASELIRRYLFAVSEELPRRLRSDVTRELRTLVEDKLEDRARALGTPADAALAAYVLHEIGEPGQVARRYDSAPQYLVGPRFYPVFVKFVKIGVVALAALLVVSTVLGHVSSPGGVASLVSLATLGRLLTRYFQIGITLFGEAVIVVAILERTALGQRWAAARDWDPRDLPEAPEAEEDRVSVPGVAVEACLTVAIGVVLNFFPHWVGIVMVNAKGQPAIVPLSEMGVHIPLFAVNLWLAWALGLKLVLLARRRWTRATRWAEVGQGLVAATALFAVVAGSTLQGPAAVPALGPVVRVFGWLFYLLPFVALIAPLRRTVRLLRSPAEAPQ